MEDIAVVVSIIAAVATLIASFFSIVLYRRKYPKRELVWEVSSTPLFSRSTGGLRVTFDHHPLREPYITTVTLSSKSRADIPSANFDASAPIRFEIGTRKNICLHVENSGGIDLNLPTQDANETPVYSIPAQLIRKDARAEFTFVTEREPDVSIDHSMVIPVRTAEEAAKRRMTKIMLVPNIIMYSLAAAAALFMLFLAIAVVYAVNDFLQMFQPD